MCYFNRLIFTVIIKLIFVYFSGYVANKKIMLPEGVDRKDTRLWEEVNIPIAEPGDLKVGDEKVQVDSLDQVSFYIPNILIFKIIEPK
jgi:ArsR family metal-binding transcriptional regulator